MTEDDESQAADGSNPPVGYGRPPVKYRFEKGKSGNPRGRPRTGRKHALKDGGPSIEDRILAAAYRPVAIRENGKVKKISTIEAILRSVNTSAIKGGARAQQHATRLVRESEENKRSAIERANKESHDQAEQPVIKADLTPQEAYYRMIKGE